MLEVVDTFSSMQVRATQSSAPRQFTGSAHQFLPPRGRHAFGGLGRLFTTALPPTRQPLLYS